LGVLISSTKIPRAEDSPPPDRYYRQGAMVQAALPHSAATTRRSATAATSSVLIDVTIALGAFVVSLALSSRHVSALRPGPHSLDWISGVLLAASTLPLVVWRRSPRGAFVATMTGSVLLSGLGYSVGLLVGPTVALYLWTASRDRRYAWTRGDTALVLGLLVANLAAAALGDHGFPSIELLHSSLGFAVAWFAGERSRLRREHLADLEARAMRADREVERERQLALAEERARIARDLHDSVGHAINVIVVRAGAARLRGEDDPARSVTALAAIEDIARQTAGDIDQIVGSLREPTEPSTPTLPPSLTSLATLIEHHTDSGLEVTLTTSGPLQGCDPPVDVAAYRILQEALTNAARHGAGCAEVAMVFGDDALEITVTNPIDGAEDPPTNAGHGLIGMRERATILAGTLDVQRTNSTFVLHARLPHRGRRP
jgi:signal transduction histidine kinase